MTKVSPKTQAPVLSRECRRGINEEFKDDANKSKELIYANQKGDVHPKRKDHDLPILPPDITRSEFNRAIDDILLLLGKENISIIDDEVLDDG